jgi:hypothetical protein
MPGQEPNFDKMADKPVLTKKFNKNLDRSRKIDEGGIAAKLYLGVQGNDLKTAKKALEKMALEKLVNEANIYVTEVNMYDITKGKDGFFSGVAEVDLISEDYRTFVNIILRYGPSAFEISEPSSVKLSTDQMHAIAGDACDFAHMYSQQIIAMFKDPERMALYQKMLKGE